MQREGESQRACDVVGFGENSVDILAVLPALPGPDGKAPLTDLRTLPGGQVATAMAGCARLGLRARYVGTFGDDAASGWLRQGLQAEGVDISASRVTSGGSRTAVILVDASTGTRTVLAHRPASLDWPPDTLPLAALTSGRLLLVDATDVAAATAACTAARAEGVLTMLDIEADAPGIDALIRVCDVIVTAESLAGERQKLHAASGARVVIATLGADGAVAWDGERDHYAPGYVVPVVDTTGAGDAFRAGLICRLLTPGPWTPGPWTPGPWPPGPWTRESLAFANAAAALNCRALGAQAGLPTREEVEWLVTRTGVPRSNTAWGRAPMTGQSGGKRPGDPA